MARFSRVHTLGLVGYVVVATACRTTSAPAPGGAVATTAPAPARIGLPTGLRPLADARADTLAIVTVAPLPRLVADADELGRRLQLPLSLGSYVASFAHDVFSQSGWHPEADEIAQLSRTRPVSFVVVGGKAGGPPRGALALTYNSADAARAAIAKLGQEQPPVRGLRVFLRPPQKKAPGAEAVAPKQATKVYVASDGERVLLGDTEEDVLAAGALALDVAAGPPPAALVHARLLIDPLARKFGVDPATLPALASMGMGAALATAQTKAKEQGTDGDVELTPELSAIVTALTASAVEPVAEAVAATITLELGGEQGVVLRTALEPKPGTRLATSASTAAAATVDPRLPINADDAMVTAWSPLPRVADLLRTTLRGSGPAGAKALAATDRYAELLTGAGSCVASRRGTITEQTCVWPLAANANARDAGNRFVDVVQTTSKWMGPLLDVKPPKVAVKRSKDAVVATVTLSYAGLPRKKAEALRKSFGPRGVLYVGLTPTGDGSVVVWQGSEPRAPHQLSPTPPRPPAEHPVNVALTRTRGADAVAYIDLMALARGSLADASDPQTRQVAAMLNAVPGFATLRAPMVLSYRGGTAANLEMQIPFSTLAGVTNLLRPFFGMMGAAGGPPPAQSR